MAIEKPDEVFNFLKDNLYLLLSFQIIVILNLKRFYEIKKKDKCIGGWSNRLYWD